MSNENKPKAQWTSLFNVGNFKVCVSAGGAFKIEDDNGRIILMGPAGNLEAIHLVLTSMSSDQLSSVIDTAQGNKAKKKETKRIEKEMSQSKNAAIKNLQAQIDLKRARGENPAVFEQALAALLAS